MNRIFFTLVLSVLTFGLFAQETLPKDPDTRVGKLSNGLTYYIRHNEKPENQACFYIAQQVGSMQEEDDQRGLAHFLEHMAFNGTENFPGKRIIDMLAENGVNFGGELNAYTSFDATVYNIDKVPTNKNSWLLDSCLIILSDWSHRLTLDDKEIDNERGVIHSEWRMRTGAGYRMLERSLPTLYPGSKYAHRMPIGIMDVVDNFPYDALKNYYKTWYYPHHQGIIVVGDINVDEMEQKIKKYFGVFETPASAPKKQLYPVPDNEKPIFVSEKDKEQTYDIIALMFKFDVADEKMKSNPFYFAQTVIKSLISRMADERFNELMQKPDAPFVQAGSDISEYLVAKTKNAFVFQAVTKEGKEFECLQTLMREALKIKKFGFLESELQRAKTEYMSSLENLYNNRDKQDNSYFVNKCVENFLNNEPMMSIEQEYQFAQAVMPEITIEIINRMAQSLIQDGGRNMVCLGMFHEKDGVNHITEDEMQQAVNKAVAEDVTAYVDNFKSEPLISQKLKTGKIASSGTGDFGTKYWILSNGAKIVYKKTDFKNDEILFEAVRFGGTSTLEVDQNNIANVRLFTSMVNSQGLGNFTSNGLSKNLTGIKCNVSPYAQNITQGLSGYSVKKDLETMFQMLYLYFTNVNRDGDDYQAFMTQQKTALKNRNANPQAVFSDSLTNALYDSNLRTKSLTLSDLDKANQSEMFEIYSKFFSEPASFTYFFVGDIDEEQLKTLVCKYLGGFKKSKTTPSYVKGRQDFHLGKRDVVFKRKMETPQSMIYDYLYSDVDFNTKNYAVAQIAAEVLGEKFFNVIREEKSIAYSAGAYSSFSHSEKQGKANDMMIFNSPVKPEHAQEAQDVMYQIVKDFADNGFDVVLMNKAQEYFVKHYQESLKNNRYWMSQITDKAVFLTDIHTDFVEAVKSVTQEDIKNYCKKLLSGNQVNVIMLPEE
jgi:zinc protease